MRLNQKEINQIERYAWEIENRGAFPDNLHYRLFLVGSSVSDFAKSRWGQADQNDPYVIYRSKRKNVTASVIEWSHIIEANRRKLSYLGEMLKTKDTTVAEIWARDYADIDQKKVRSILEAK